MVAVIVVAIIMVTIVMAAVVAAITTAAVVAIMAVAVAIPVTPDLRHYGHRLHGRHRGALRRGGSHHGHPSHRARLVFRRARLRGRDARRAR